jgi:hypothetical protein
LKINGKTSFFWQIDTKRIFHIRKDEKVLYAKVKWHQRLKFTESYQVTTIGKYWSNGEVIILSLFLTSLKYTDNSNENLWTFMFIMYV